MKYSEQITIGIPVRIDSPARMRNLRALLRHLSLSGIKIHVWEAGDVRSELVWLWPVIKTPILTKEMKVRFIIKQCMSIDC